MFFYIYIFLCLVLFLYLNKILKKKILISETGEIHQKFASKNKIPLSGGLFFIFSCIYYFNFELIIFYLLEY